MTFYCGIDLHSKKSHVCVIDKDGKKVKEENLNNDLSLILQFLMPSGTPYAASFDVTDFFRHLISGSLAFISADSYLTLLPVPFP